MPNNQLNNRRSSPSGGQYPRRPVQNKKPNGSSALTISGTILKVLITLGACVFLAIFILNSASDLFGLNQKDNDYEITIPEDLDIAGLSKILIDNNIVSQKFTFNLYANMQKDKFTIKPGTYTFNSNMAYDQIFAIVNTGDRSNLYATISFPEGLSLDEIAAILEEKGVCNADEFLAYVQNHEFLNYSFYNMIPDSDTRYLKMEGYFFPDTYEFYIDSKVSTVAAKFLDNFNLHMNNNNLNDRMKAINMTLDEVITLASLIQKEADEKEMRRVSSVFHNRLDNPANFPNLQSDVTINYVEEHIKGKNRHYTVDSSQEVFDAYNTYVAEGLPVGPICNPGEDAIMAVLYPPETNYYYFVTDVDGEYYFSSSLGEHDANVATAVQQDETGEGKIGGIRTHVEGADSDK